MSTVLKSIVLTGGPCGGKTSALSALKARFEAQGWHVCVLPETATFLMQANLNITDPAVPQLTFQRAVLDHQLACEEIFAAAARDSGWEKTLLLCDRGILDGMAYCTPEDFCTLLADHGMTLEDGLTRYDGVFHLVTSAKGAEAAYGTGTNALRYEGLEQARRTDDATLAAWQGCPVLQVIENRGTFAEKLEDLAGRVQQVLNAPAPCLYGGAEG